MKTGLEILNGTEEILSKSVKPDNLEPKDVVEDGDKIRKDVKKSAAKTDKVEGDDDELTPEEKEALESGEYDYEPDEEEEDDEEDNEEETIEEGEEYNKSIENISLALMNSLNRIETLEKSLASAVRRINSLSSKNEKLAKSLKGQPLGRKSIGGRVLEKSFATSAGIEVPTGLETMSKSQRAEVLSKAMMSGNTEVKPTDVLKAEMTGYVRPELEVLFNK